MRYPWINRPCHADARSNQDMVTRPTVQIESKVVGRYNMHAGMTDTTHGLSDQ